MPILAGNISVRHPKTAKPLLFSSPRRGYPAALAAAMLCTAIALPFRDDIEAVNFAMLYMVGVVSVAARYGLWPSLTSSFLSLLAFDFFFTHPYNSLTIYHTDYIVTLLVMTTCGVIVSSLAARLRLQAIFFRERESHVSALYDLTKALSSTRGRETIAEVACAHIRKIFNGHAMALLPDETGEFKAFPGNIGIWDIKDDAVARWAYEQGKPSGLGTTTMPGSPTLYMPLLAQETSLGVLSLTPEHRLHPNELALLDTCCTLLASALARAQTAENAERLKFEAETEKLRNTLLTSIGHDLRTPLTSITGITGSLLQTTSNLPAPVQEALRSVHGQSTRMARIVTNLLNITRLDAGNVKLNKQPCYIEELIGSALARIREIENSVIETDIEPNLPLISIDEALIEQVIINLLENAVKYTGQGSLIRLRARHDGNELLVQVADQGSGIPLQEREHVFNRFYRSEKNPDGTGSGLGLAICKAAVIAHGGRIWAGEEQGGGALISFTLPTDTSLQQHVQPEQ